MAPRLLAAVLVVAALGGLIAYSQLTSEPDHVSGFVEAEDVRLGSRVGGRVAEVLVEEGDRVTKGQLLVRLEPYDLKEQRAAAAADLAARQAEFDKLTAGLRPEEVAQAAARVDRLSAYLKKLRTGPRPQEIGAARARLAQAEAELRLTDRNLKRIEAIAERGAATQEELDTAVEQQTAANNQARVRQQELELLEIGTREEEIQEAEAQLTEANEALALAQQGFRDEEIAQAKAARDAAQASLEAIDRRLEELKVFSPVDGVVEALDLEPGDLTSPGAPFMSVLDTSKYWVRAYVPQRRMDLAVGQHLRVTVDSLPDDSFDAELIFVARQAEFTPGNVQTPEDRAKLVYRIKALLPGDHKRLRPGVTADVWLDKNNEE
ncbi:Multidrug export protein EmrA [Posidoniimonas polymericola]|uniref:Multidrug export protein EmrA n=1 Tax=Posidoniimonas polymericola TaxID=2528002 RepID=A0A5C5XU96_9BACT|nr:HlyD family efflux transporter periplasmic adaptor subunit [Posidoniimonas polymericola]TWT65172.1 Multidrug export protein EmrA [Posidoniimonas polymericola]